MDDWKIRHFSIKLFIWECGRYKVINLQIGLKIQPTVQTIYLLENPCDAKIKIF